ncbi:hypothetical protein [Natrarchaeobius oligotrophus]|uniref:hypothetical protein n=1 Tax=Natrarchaeobius oligotrophus TaxID=3455743 RepID=UPI000F5423FF|nr:hypothetical protein [Natrarchaeobius chitinivorans]
MNMDRKVEDSNLQKENVVEYSDDDDDSLDNFCDDYLQSKQDVAVYKKSKKYAKYGVVATAGILYIAAGFYYESWSEYSHWVTALTISGLFLGFITIMLWNNAKNSDIDEEKVDFHDIAALIDAYNTEGVEGLLIEYNSLEDRFKNNALISSKRRSDFRNFVSSIDLENDSNNRAEIQGALKILADDAIRIDKKEITALHQEKSTDIQGNDPGIITIVSSAINSKNINSEYLFWTLFFIAAGIGVVIALWQGHGWGVLIVTILFFGLRFYDNRNS